MRNEEVRPVYFALLHAGPTARKFTTVDIGRMVTEMVIETATTEWAAAIVPALKNDGSLPFCVDYYWKLIAATICDPYTLSRLDAFIDSWKN